MDARPPPGDHRLIVAFKINWRSVSELFGVVFQEYLAYTASACADHKTVPRRFNYFIGDEVKVVNFENPFDLGEKSSQEPEISAGHPYEAGDDLWDEFFVGKRTPAGVQRRSSSSCTWLASKGRNSWTKPIRE